MLNTGEVDEWWTPLFQEMPRITFIVPAYNEAANISESLRALLALDYPALDIVVINDGSTDGTMEVLQEQFALVEAPADYERLLDTKPLRGLYRTRNYPQLLVADKDNGGKADALNLGLNLASGEIICAIDADTLIEQEALIRALRPFRLDSSTVAVGGTIRVVNGSDVRGGQIERVRAPRHPLEGFQVIEYLRGFLVGRLGWNRLGGNLIVSGAFGLFKREAVIAVGGYLPGSVGEDLELIVRLRRHGYEMKEPYRVGFIPYPVAWTEVPRSIRSLGRQRERWHRGLADTLRQHKSMLFHPAYGSVGMLSYIYLCLELGAPVVEAVGIIAIIIGFVVGAVNLPFAISLFLVVYGYGLLMTMCSLLFEEFSFHRYGTVRDRVLLLIWAIFENFGYRQLTILWRLRGLFRSLRGRSPDWGVMQRMGYTWGDRR
jgi:cellulose synthase/poly-beta-1,6-N-acetylglucosamine synthase-like glycosyltransferase